MISPLAYIVYISILSVKWLADSSDQIIPYVKLILCLGQNWLAVGTSGGPSKMSLKTQIMQKPCKDLKHFFGNEIHIIFDLHRPTNFLTCSCTLGNKLRAGRPKMEDDNMQLHRDSQSWSWSARYSQGLLWCQAQSRSGVGGWEFTDAIHQRVKAEYENCNRSYWSHMVRCQSTDRTSLQMRAGTVFCL